MKGNMFVYEKEILIETVMKIFSPWNIKEYW